MSELEKRTRYWQSHGLSARAVNCLAYGGVASLEEANVSVLLTARSCGVKTDAEIAGVRPVRRPGHVEEGVRALKRGLS
jgi:hypothetical protein